MTLVKLLAGILIIASLFGCGSSEAQGAAPDLTAKPTGPRPGIAGSAGGGQPKGADAKAAIAN